LARGNSGQCERTHGEEESSEAGEADGTRRFRGISPRATGKCTKRVLKQASVCGSASEEHGKETHSRQEDPGNCVKAWTSVKRAVTRPDEVRLRTWVDNRKGAGSLERGVRFFARGKL
jgi:hypothetical protein